MLEDFRPVSALLLPEQPGAGVPGAILPVEQPAEIRNTRQQDPDCLTQGAGQVSNRGVDRDHEVHQRDKRRSIGEVLQAVSEVPDLMRAFEDFPVLRTYSDVAPGQPVALLGSSENLEISVRDGSAAEVLGIDSGARVAARPRR